MLLLLLLLFEWENVLLASKYIPFHLFSFNSDHFSNLFERRSSEFPPSIYHFLFFEPQNYEATIQNQQQRKKQKRQCKCCCLFFFCIHFVCAFRHMFFPVPYGVMRSPIGGSSITYLIFYFILSTLV